MGGYWMMQRNAIDFGSVQIHKTVLEELVFSVIEKIDGVNLIKSPMTKKVFAFLFKKNFEGIDIKVEGDHAVSIDVRVEISYGKNIPAIAIEVQNAIKSEIEKTVDINLKSINVNVQGMSRIQMEGEK